MVFDADPFSSASVTDMSRRRRGPGRAVRLFQATTASTAIWQVEAPSKFWGCGANLQPGQFTRGRLTQRIRYLRKSGVNMVRQHPVWTNWSGSSPANSMNGGSTNGIGGAPS